MLDRLDKLNRLRIKQHIIGSENTCLFRKIAQKKSNLHFGSSGSHTPGIVLIK